MPYKTVAELPDAVKKMPQQAQEIYMSAFNAAFKQYDGNEGKAHGTAWAAVKMKYKQNEDGRWITKEANMSSIETLQKQHSEIIQEVWRRNVASDSTQLKEIMELCHELLASDEADEGKIQEAIRKSSSMLTWLSEQAAMRTEDGVKYPASAFAYVSDAENPSGWKLRLWEDLDKKVTRAQLNKASAALSPGGLRGEKVAIPSADLSAVKRGIRAEYRKIGVEDDEIPRWVREAETREVLQNFVPLTEAKFEKGRAVVVVIEPGFNASEDTYYPKEMLKRDFKVFEGMKMYADHPTADEDKARPERSIRDWVATLVEVVCDGDGNVTGVAEIVEPWLMQKLAALRDKSMLSEMGISINAVGNASKATIDGKETLVIERLVACRSVDFVTEPGAGGVVQFYEVDRSRDVDLIELSGLRERRPDLVKAIESTIRAEITKEVKKVMESDQKSTEKIEELTGQITTLTTERDELKGKVTEADKEKAKAEAQASIKGAVDKAELPDTAKAHLIERFGGAESMDGIEVTIKAEVDYIAKLSESGKVKGMGGSAPASEEDQKKLTESFKRLNPEWTDEQIATAVLGR